MRILIIGPSWVGDMVMAQTLFTVLKQRHPECLIDVLAPEWSRPLLERMPEVRRALSFPLGHGALEIKVRRKIGHSLQGQYEQAIVLPNSFKSALTPFFAKIPQRTGWRGEMRYGLLNDLRKLDKKQYPLMIERFMALACDANENLEKPYPRPSLQVNKENAHAALQRFSLDLNKPILSLCPGAEFGLSKKWPSQHYAELANHYVKQGWQVWIFGSKNDHATGEEIAQLIDDKSVCFNLAGETSLAEAIDLLSFSDAVISNDSGLMHIAAALNRPLVAIYGSTSPDFTPPLADEVAIVRTGISCSPCFERTCRYGHYHCLTELESSMAIDALDNLIGKAISVQDL